MLSTQAEVEQVLRSTRMLFLSRWPFTIVALTLWGTALLIAFYLLLEFSQTSRPVQVKRGPHRSLSAEFATFDLFNHGRGSMLDAKHGLLPRTGIPVDLPLTVRDRRGN